MVVVLEAVPVGSEFLQAVFVHVSESIKALDSSFLQNRGQH